MSATRAEVRRAFAALVAAGLAGEGNPAQETFDHRPADFNARSPVIVVTSGGSFRQRMTMQGFHQRYTLDVYLFVLYADEASGWTEADAEDKLDELEAALAELAAANQRHPDGLWRSIDFDEMPSDRTSAVVGGGLGGLEYATERVRLHFSVY